MSQDPPQYTSDYLPVPSRLHSFETGKPFERCIGCGLELLKDGTGYLIQKVYQGEEVIMEMAYCVGCHDEMAASYSKETTTQLWNFYLDRVDFATRQKTLSQSHPKSLDGWTAHCMTCGKAKSETKSYALIAQCDGPDLIFVHLPALVCEGCQVEMSERMSAASRETWDRWLEERLDMPPSLKQDLKDGKIVFV